MKTFSFHTIFLLCLFTHLSPAAISTYQLIAQSGGQAGSFQRMGFGPRGMSMGNAMTATTAEGVYGYYNPALAGMEAKQRQIDISSAVMEFDRSMNMASIHFNLPPSAGLGFYILHAGVREIDGRTSSGYHTEMLSTHDYQLGTQFAIRFHNRVWGGIGLKLNMADYHEEIDNSTGLGFDFGLRFLITDRFALGLVIQDVLASYRWDTSVYYGDTFGRNTIHHFPVRIKAGVAYDPGKKVQIATEFEYRLNQNNDNPGLDAENSLFFRLGTRYELHERLTVRSGIRTGDLENDALISLSAGFSLHLPLDKFSPSVDYAFVQETNRVTNLHLFALRLHL